MDGYLELEELAEKLGTTPERAKLAIRRRPPAGTIHMWESWLVPEEALPYLQQALQSEG